MSKQTILSLYIVFIRPAQFVHHHANKLPFEGTKALSIYVPRVIYEGLLRRRRLASAPLSNHNALIHWRGLISRVKAAVVVFKPPWRHAGLFGRNPIRQMGEDAITVRPGDTVAWEIGGGWGREGDESAKQRHTQLLLSLSATTQPHTLLPYVTTCRVWRGGEGWCSYTQVYAVRRRDL